MNMTKSDPREIVLSPELYERAYSEGTSLSGYLEKLDPSREYKGTEFDGTDAFERQMFWADIMPFSYPERGVWSDRVSKFYEQEGAAVLFPEFIARVWRSVSTVANKTPGLDGLQRFYMSSSPVSDVLHPDYIQSVARQKQIAPAIPLSEIVAITTGIDSGVYRAFYLKDDEDERRMARVAEGTEVPTVELTGGDHTISVRKYGRRLLGSYETFRRMTIDRFALHLALLAVQAEVDKVKTAIDVIVNGDGNTTPAVTAATNHNLLTLDTDAVAGAPTLKGYLAWMMQWGSPYACNVVLAKQTHALELLMCNAGTANVLFGQVVGMFGIGGVTPISGQLGPVRLGWDAQCPTETWVGIDNRFAIEMVTEIGASLTETDKIISRQFNEIVMTESIGFAVLDPNSSKTLTLNA